jgi:hypothetical protein
MVPIESQAMHPTMTAVREVETRAQRPSVVDKAVAAFHAERRRSDVKEFCVGSDRPSTMAPALLIPRLHEKPQPLICTLANRRL